MHRVSHLKPVVPNEPIWKLHGWEIGECIGQGTFATLHIAKCTLSPRTLRIMQGYRTSENSRFAVKIICKETANDRNSMELVKAEIQALRRCKNAPFIAQLQFLQEDQANVYIGMEYFADGDLHAKMASEGILYLEAIGFITEICQALHSIHSRGIFYNDLKPENICLTRDGHIKIVDFGLCTILEDKHYNPRTNRYEAITTCGTLEYAAPEIFLRQPHGFESDWWSFGVVSYELLCGSLPFPSEGTEQQKCDRICFSESFLDNELILPGSREYNFIKLFLVKSQKDRAGYAQSDIVKIIKDNLFHGVDTHLATLQEFGIDDE